MDRWKKRFVAPFVGAWIEIRIIRVNIELIGVAPFVGAWIEMGLYKCILNNLAVAPFVGAWIEIPERTGFR